MGREKIQQTSFSAGELSPRLHDRVDLDAYYAGCAEIENFIPLPHGPLVRRRGSKFLARAKQLNARLIPFTFNITQSFVLEITSESIRVFHESGILINDEEGEAPVPVEIKSPFLEEDLPNLNWAQHGDWLFITCGRIAPQVIKRYGNTDWRVEELEFTNMPEEWGEGSWPRYIALYEQRAYYSSTAKKPQQYWASRTGLYEDFTMHDMVEGKKTILDDHAFTYTIFSNNANGIEWTTPISALMIGTAGAEFVVTSSSSIDPITPKNISCPVQTHYGSANIRPVKIGTNIIFVQRSKNRVRAYTYSFSEDQYTAQDLTMFASHILEGRAKEMDVQSAPDSYIWIVTEDGDLIGCTYEKEQKILAWHRHTTNGKIKNICVLPCPGNDIIYITVERIIAGQPVLYIEILKDSWEPAESSERAFYVDCGLTYEGEEIDELVGLSHLDSEEVDILVDGWVHPRMRVEQGKVKLQRGGKLIHVGIPFTSRYLSLVPQSQQQISVGMTRRIHQATIALESSTNFKFRIYSQEDFEVYYAGPTNTMGKAIALKSSHVTVQTPGASDARAQLEIIQDAPHPLTLRGIVYDVHLKDI